MLRKLAVFTLLAIVALSMLPGASPTSAQTGTITLNGTVKVVEADITASNGVIHTIDGVLIQPFPAMASMSATATVTEATAVATIGRGRGRGEGEGGDEGGEGGGEGDGEGGIRSGTPSPSVADVIAANPDLSTFSAALKATGLTAVLSQQQSVYTVFAPTNEAFAAFLKAKNMTVDNLLADKTTLTQILTYHVVDKVLLGIDLATMTSVTTLNGADIAISTSAAALAPAPNTSQLAKVTN